MRWRSSGLATYGVALALFAGPGVVRPAVATAPGPDSSARPCQDAAKALAGAGPLHAEAARALCAQLAPWTTRVVLVPLPLEAGLGSQSAAEHRELVARPLRLDGPLPSRVVVWLDERGGGRATRVVPVRFELQAFGWRWAARVAVAAGEPVEGSAFERRELRLTQCCAAEPDVLPPAMVLRQGLAAGQPLSETSWRVPLAIARGDEVTAVSAQGAVRIEARARALQAGQPGRDVLVRIDGATAPIWARVLHAGRVELQ